MMLYDVPEALKKKFNQLIHTWSFRLFWLAWGMELLLEGLGRHSVFKALKFMCFHPYVFLYNTVIIFFTLLFGLLFRKRVFSITIIAAIWIICGIVNFVVLTFRITPFAAIDFTMFTDALSMIDVYLKKWQQIAIVIAAIFLLIGLVILFRKSPKYKGKLKTKSTIIGIIFTWLIILLMTDYSTTHEYISDDFANLGMAYEDYGFAYCFTNSIIDNGIEKSLDYNEAYMQHIKNELSVLSTHGEAKHPNVIIIQLESFFDPKYATGITLSENPLPNFTKFKEEYPSGFLTVPALGAGTANSEFEVLTGFKSSFFGAGEYPYKTTVNSTPVESLCSILKRQGYGAYAMHNNTATFYDRNHVYDEMGFDHFTSVEYMYDVEYTDTGWAKDNVLINEIMKCLEDTDHQDFVFTISVQGHGRYPEDENRCEEHVKVSYDGTSADNQWTYYINQINEMDTMIGDLKEALDAYGEDYVLVLYGDHMPTLITEESQIQGCSLFQTEYIIVNNIDLKLKDKDIAAYEVSTRLLQALNLNDGYAQKAQRLYKGDELEKKLCIIAYDEMFGENYLFDGHRPALQNTTVLGVDEIVVKDVANHNNNIVVTGENFNEFSVITIDGKSKDTEYINRNTLMIEDDSVELGEVVSVEQHTKSGRTLSQANEVIFH